MKKIAAILAALAATFAFAATPASAAPSISGAKPSATTENQTVPLTFSLSGVTWSDVLVTVTVVEGGLTVTPSGGVVAAAGYDLANGTSNKQAFRGSLADVKETLKAGINWLTPAAPGTYALDISMKVQAYVEGLSFNPENGHYYLVPNETLSAREAFTKAENGDYTYAGLTGYIAEINDEAENDFVATYSGGSNIWIGGSADYQILNAHAGTSFVDNAASRGKWYWVHSEVQFGEGLAPTTAIGGRYMNWADFEPNNADDPDEACIVTNWQNVPGEWNDLNCGDNHSNSFIIEFEPAAGSAGAILTLNTEDLIDPLADTGVSSNGLAAIALAALAAGAFTIRAARKRIA